jgi:hypothetical protein
MLGTRRTSVTVAAGILQRAGLVAHTRGDVEIIDRRKLEEAACDCYGIMQRQIKEWKGDSWWLASVHAHALKPKARRQTASTRVSNRDHKLAVVPTVLLESLQDGGSCSGIRHPPW